jgi:hypothetical protein
MELIPVRTTRTKGLSEKNKPIFMGLFFFGLVR